MSYKRVLIFFISVCLATCAVGCATVHQQEIIPQQTVEQTNPSAIGSGVGVEDEVESNNVVAGNAMVWEKQETLLTINTLQLSKDWNEFIIIGGEKVYAVNYTDMSVLPNYYYGDNDSYADLQTVYYVPTYRLSVATDNVFVDRYISATMDVVCTTDNTETNKHAIIEEVRFVTNVNQYEGGGIETLAAHSTHTSDGRWGIGSKYDYVETIIGNATTTTTNPMDEGFSLTNCLFVGDDVRMILTFVWRDEDGLENAVLTSIDWIASTIGSDLHTQDGIELFERYNKTK